MTQAAIETLWGAERRARVDQFPISDNLLALIALVMADLRQTLMNLIYQRDVEWTALTLQQREFLITLFHAPKSSLENPSWAHKSGLRSLISISYGELDQYEGRWVQDEFAGDERSLDEHEDLFWVYDEGQCFWMKFPFQGRSLRKRGKSKGKGKTPGKSKGGKGSGARQFFRPCHKGGGKGKKSGKGGSSFAGKANIAEEEAEEEEAEDDALLTDKKKREREREKATSKEEEEQTTTGWIINT